VSGDAGSDMVVSKTQMADGLTGLDINRGPGIFDSDRSGFIRYVHFTLTGGDTTSTLIDHDASTIVLWNSKVFGRTSRIGTRSFCDSIGESVQLPLDMRF